VAKADGLMRLSDYPLDVVNVSCGKCVRQGRYKKQTLIERFGGAITVSDLRWKIAADCSKAIDRQLGADPCGIVYPDLLDGYRAEKAVEEG
jgi:hypothetical protein